MNSLDRVDHSSVFVLGGAHDDDSVAVQEIHVDFPTPTKTDTDHSTRFWLLIWTMVLQQYTEAQQLILSLYADHDDGHTIDRSAYSVSLMPESDINEVLCNQGGQFHELSADASEPKYNTGVLISEGSCDASASMNGSEQTVRTPEHQYDPHRFRLTKEKNCQVLLAVNTANSTPKVRLYYRRSALSDWYAQRIASTVGQAIAETVSDSNRPIGSLNFFSRQNYADVSQWTLSAHDEIAPAAKSVADLISNQVQNRPEAPAIEAWDGTLTFGELEECSNRLAAQLRQRLVQPDDRVLVCFDRSCWAVVGFLAILKTGAAFVPVDAGQPLERLQLIAKGTDSKLVIATEAQSKVAAQLGIEVVTLTKDTVDQLPQVDGFPAVAGKYAYILHTSGSTGVPKGVLVKNSGLAHSVYHASTWRIDGESRVLQFASYSFAISMVEVFSALTSGATLCIPSNHDRLNNLEKFIIEFKVNWALITPSASSSLDPSAVSSCFRTLLLAGEAMNRQHVEKWAHMLELGQVLGMTEASGICSVFPRMTSRTDQRTIGNSQLANLWLVDPADPNRLPPVGAVAELLIEGPCIAEGYLNNEEKTAESFVQDPAWMQLFRSEGHTRLYKTGDLVQYGPQGLLYIGRKDGQVKVRGKRVELGEVEYHVRRHCPQAEKVIATAAIPLQSDETPMLVVFLHSQRYTAREGDGFASVLGTPTEQFRSEVSELHSVVPQTLPEYMIPDAYLPLARLPMTRTGKMDHGFLRKLVGSLTRREIEGYNFAAAELVQPRTETERKLHSLYAEILQLETQAFGIHDHFLRLGGDSIKAMRMAHAGRSKGLTLNVENILGGQTVAKTAEQVDMIKSPLGDEGYGSAGGSLESLSTVDPFKDEKAAAQQQLTECGLVEDVEAIYPCSPMQEGILLSQARDPQYYDIRVLWEVAGEADVERLQHSWELLMERHPLLRTVFLHNVTPDRFVVQATLKRGAAATVHYTELNRPALVELQNERFQPKQPQDWLPHLSIHRNPDGRVFAFLQLTHALTDAQSLSILTRDWQKLYLGHDLSSLDLDYEDYVSYLQGIPMGPARKFWQSYLHGSSPCIFPRLTTDLNEPGRSFEVISLDVGASAAKYHRYCEQKGITMATLLKLAWSLVLRRYTGMDGISFGYASSGRDLPLDGIEDAMGPFVNALIFHMNFPASMSLDEALEAVQLDLFRVLPHQRMSLAEIRKDLGHVAAMFNTCMTFPAVVTAEPQEISFQEVERQDPTEYDILLEVAAPNRQALEVTIKYWTHLLSDRQAKRLASTLHLALDQIVQGSQQSVGHVDLMLEDDRKLLSAWNPEGEAIEATIHGLIEQRSIERRSHPAVEARDGKLTYSELQRESDRLALHLLSSSPHFGPKTFVPLCFSKTKWTPVAVLAVLKAGATFLLIDPSQPVQRLQEICQELSPPLILASNDQASLAEQLIPGLDVFVVGGQQQPTWENGSAAELPAVSTSDLAYVVYTSGSTGKPRGVLIEHRSFCSAAIPGARDFSVFPESRVMQFASHAFDASVLDILAPLLVGATVCIPSEEDRRDRLAAAVNDFQITSTWLTPSVARLLSPEQVPSLKSLGLVGEAMSLADLQTWAPHVNLINAYGPAECSIMVTAQTHLSLDSEILIGRSTGSAATWVVDPNDHEKLAPIGVPGELIVEGPSVARGYLQRPEHTAAYFIQPPRWLSKFRADPMGPLYKTGDLVQYNDAGALRYIGRKDTQVKIRGQRLELSEVEKNVHDQFPVDSNVTVELIAPEGRSSFLGAFVYMNDSAVVHDNQKIFGDGNEEFNKHVSTVRSRIDKVLPSYMRPAIYIPLLQIPLSPSGKTNRRLLRELASQMPRDALDKFGSPAEARRAPSTQMEKVMQRYFSEILGLPLEEIGADDHFFNRGGDSLTAMKMVGLARKDNHNISVKDIFDHPQLGALASIVSTGDGDEGAPEPFSLLTGNVDGIVQAAAAQCNISESMIEDAYPCTPLQEGLIASTVREPGAYVVDLAFVISSHVDLGHLEDAWNTVADANPILRTRIASSDSSGMLQLIVREKIQWTVLEDRAADGGREFREQINIGKPLAQFVIQPIKSGGQMGHELLVKVHHALYDAWSFPLILEQVDAAYHGQKLSARPFSPFIRYLRSVQGHEKHWRSVFADLKAPIFPSLPTKSTQPSPSVVTDMTAEVNTPATREFTQRTFLRLAWAITQSHVQACRDVVHGLVVSGRNAPVTGVESLTAPTIATIPCRVLLDLDASAIDALRMVHADTMASIPYEQTGLQNISRFGPEASKACSFQTLLVMQQGGTPESSSIFKEMTFAGDYSSFSSYALTLICDIQGDSLKTKVVFDNSVIKGDQVQHILSLFSKVLRSIQENPSVRIRDAIPLGYGPSELGFSTPSVTVDETKEFWNSELSRTGAATFPSLPSASYQPLTNASFVHGVELQRKSDSEFSTPTLVRAAWGLLQSRYSDSAETIVGCTVNEPGSPVTIVPVRVGVVLEHGINAFMRDVQDQWTAMRPHQGFGLQNIARLGDSASASCNFQTLLVMHRSGTESKKMPVQQASTQRVQPVTVSLALEFIPYANGIVTHAHFDDRVLGRDQVVRMVLQFEHALTQLNVEPAGALSDIELVSQKDKHDVQQWNMNISDRVDECVHHLIEKQVALRPQAPAICSWDGEMTYAQLDQLSSVLANYLIDVGVVPGMFVPLCFEKSMWTIVALFAVMKAGGAFVFLDPAAPQSRLETVSKEVDAKVMLCSDNLLSRFPDLVERTIPVGPNLKTLTNQPKTMARAVSPADAAYVLFTSGSTGTPKGSLIEHRAFSTAALAFKEGLQMNDRVLQFASYAFDASLLEILGPLVQGGCVCVPSETERRGNITGAIERMKVNWATLTPSFASTLDPTTVPSLKTLCLAGEAMSTTLMDTWTPYVHLVNGYGPSECCICSVSNRRVTGGPGSNPANIGTAVAGACWVVEPHDDQKLAPVGAAGELLIEGHAIARHYINNPEKTAQAFIPRPSWLPFDRCDRLYKTGDLVRYMADGSMVFVGRKDTQIKIRGQRVEIGEIEHHLLSPENVALGVVAYPKSGIFAKRLTAVLELTMNDGHERTIMRHVSNDRLQSIEFDPSSVSQHMSQHLPVHMVPDVWIVVEKLPTSLSAKIDRRAVDDWLSKLPSDFQPAMGATVQDMPVLPVLDRNETKATAISNKIADLVSRGDDSMRKALEGREFTIASTGLDSIQVISLSSFIQQSYGVNVPVGKILDGKTSVRSLSALIDNGINGEPAQEESDTFDASKEADLLTQSVLQNCKQAPASGKIVFVTGATGFLGTQILRQLCDRPDVSKVFAHVRATTAEAATARCKDAAVRAQWWNESYASKIEAWPGNLSKPRLGLSDVQWASLTGRGPNLGVVDVIIHAGAAVNWNAGYELLRPANVNSTVELLQAAIVSTAQPRFVYVSGGHRWQLGETEESISEQVAGANGYGQTKYASELLVKRFAATSKTGQFSVVKPGLIIGTPEEGVANTDDYLWRLTAGAVDIQAYSAEHSDAWVCMTSSARVAEETIHSGFCLPSEHKTVVYMTDGITESEFWDVVRGDLKYPLRPMTHSSWMSQMRKSIDSRGSKHSLWPVKHTFEMIQGRFGGDAPGVDVEHRKPHVKAAVKKNVEFLVDVGFVANQKGLKGSYLANKVFERTRNVWSDLSAVSLVPGK